MPQNQTITCNVDVEFAVDVNHFPAQGDRSKFYFDNSSGDFDKDEGDLYIWNGTGYSYYYGPRPHKPPVNP